MSIQLNLSQDEVDYINTVLHSSVALNVYTNTQWRIDAVELVEKIQEQAKRQWVHVGNKPSPAWTKEESQ